MTAAAANIINLQQARIVSLGSLQPKQLLFCQSRKKYVAYGGARAGGKSWVVRFKAKGLALYYPGIKILSTGAVTRTPRNETASSWSA